MMIMITAIFLSDMDTQALFAHGTPNMTNKTYHRYEDDYFHYINVKEDNVLVSVYKIPKMVADADEITEWLSKQKQE